jgi:hypothetical protein
MCVCVCVCVCVCLSHFCFGKKTSVRQWLAAAEVLVCAQIVQRALDAAREEVAAGRHSQKYSHSASV